MKEKWEKAKNWTIGFLSGYIFVNLPFWEWEGDLVAQGFLLLITAVCVATLLWLHDLDVEKARKKKFRRGYMIRKTITTEIVKRNPAD